MTTAIITLIMMINRLRYSNTLMLLAIITYTAFCVTHNYTVNERGDDRRSRLAIPLGETDPIPRFRADTTRIKYG